MFHNDFIVRISFIVIGLDGPVLTIIGFVFHRHCPNWIIKPFKEKKLDGPK